jgi:hypothetical protein
METPCPALQNRSLRKVRCAGNLCIGGRDHGTAALSYEKLKTGNFSLACGG